MNKEELRKKVLDIPMQKYFTEIVKPNMPGYYDGDYPVDFEVKNYVKCCLHDENTPSMRYYEDTNTLYCFGCGTFANTIILHKKFVEKINGVQIDDDEAIQFLYNYFIKGNEETSLSKKAYKTYKNKPVDIARYSVYRKNIEESVNVDNTIDDNKKRRIWAVIDNMDRFMEKDKITAQQAINAIQDTIKLVLG